MRIRTAIALASLTLAPALLAQSPGAGLAIVIDSDSPIADAREADRLIEAALAGMGGDRAAVTFELTADGIRRLPAEGANALPIVHFVPRPPRHGSLALTVSEASDILRKNEAVRDGVIRRECGDPPAPECAGAVHASAIALIEDTD